MTLASPSVVPVHQWLEAVANAPVPPTTKLLCHGIARFFNSTDVRGGAFPSVRKLMKETGLSNRSIATHGVHACRAGLLVIERKPGAGCRFSHNHYWPQLPPCDAEKSNEVAPAPNEEGSLGPCEGGSPAPVKEVHVDHVKEVHTNYPIATSVATATENLDFEEQSTNEQALARCREIARHHNAPFERLLEHYRAWSRDRPAKYPRTAMIRWFAKNAPKWAARNAKTPAAASFGPQVRSQPQNPNPNPNPIRINYGKQGWEHWCDFLQRRGKRDLAEALKRTGHMWVPSQFADVCEGADPIFWPCVDRPRTAANSGPEIASVGQSNGDAA